jgi:hypothetical protein
MTVIRSSRGARFLAALGMTKRRLRRAAGGGGGLGYRLQWRLDGGREAAPGAEAADERAALALHGR